MKTLVEYMWSVLCFVYGHEWEYDWNNLCWKCTQCGEIRKWVI